MEYLHKDLTDRIIRAFYNVYNQLGFGFLEEVYERALLIELQESGLKASAQQQIKVFYKGQTVGDYFADVVVEEKVIIEVKTAQDIAVDHDKQLQNYLRATSIEVGLILNFGPKPQISRKVYSNERKRIFPT